MPSAAAIARITANHFPSPPKVPNFPAVDRRNPGLMQGTGADSDARLVRTGRQSFGRLI
jgi:hypothetical protein